MSYEECSLFETSTTQMPILSRIESLAVHINTFQAQIKKCKQNKKYIYIYIIFPLSKGFKSQCSKSFWTQNLRSTLFSWDKQVLAKATAFFNTWGGESWTEWKRERQEGKGRGKRMRREQVCTREDGQLGHTHGELVNFIYWTLTFSFWIF